MNTDSELREKGFVVVNDVLTKSEAMDVYCDIEQLFNIYNGTKQVQLEKIAFPLFQNDFQAYIGCCNAAQRLPSLHRIYAKNSLMRHLGYGDIRVPAFSTPPLLNFSHRKVAKNSYNWKLAAHQDWPSNQGSVNGLTVWIPFVDATTRMGALNVIPGSHVRGCLPHEPTGASILTQPPKGGWRSIEVMMGQALIMNTFLIHRAGTNVTSRIRLTAAARYNDLTERSYIARGYPLPPAFHDRATEWPNEAELEAIKRTNESRPS